ncbi:unnamed protein product [Ectocarpus sp. 13 AM-2016]
MKTRKRARGSLNRITSYVESLTGITVENKQRQVKGRRFREYYLGDNPGIRKMLDRPHFLMRDSWIENKREDVKNQ